MIPHSGERPGVDEGRTLTAALAEPSASVRDEQDVLIDELGVPDLLLGTEPPPKTQWALARRRFFRHKMAVLSLVVLIAMYVLCFGAAFFAPYEQNEQDLLLGDTPPSAEHWLGTDRTGRDQFSELLYAGQISLKIGVAVALVSTVVGTITGAVAGYYGRWIDQLLVQLTDLFLIVPALAVLAIALKKFGYNDLTIILVLAGLGWMVIARVVRGQVLSVKEKEFVEAAKAAGASDRRIVLRHILPNCLGPIMVNATLAVAAAIITESTLSYLGFGVQPPQTSWGNMLEDARGSLGSGKGYLILGPALCVITVVMCINFLGDGLRDALDPQASK